MELSTLIKAGYPLLAAKTQEPIRFTLEAAKIANGRRVIQLDAIRGWREIGAQSWEEADPFTVPGVAAQNPGSVWILNNFHFWLKEPEIIQGIQNMIPHYKAAGITLIFLGPGFEAPPELARDIRTITFDLPGRDDLGAIIDAMAESQGVDVDPETRGQVVDNLMGLTTEEAENALAWGLVTDKAFVPGTIGKVKASMIENSAGLKFSTFSETLDSLIGNDNLKGWALNRFARRRAGFTGAKSAPPFRGVLLLGKPGNGKSHFAKALGRSVGWPTLTLDIGRLLGGLVGQSEEQADRAFQIIDAVAPCVLFIDELEKALTGIQGGGDGGTSMRVAAKFLQWLQDHESEVFTVATCNDIKALSAASDGAFTRAGRWDAIFFVDNPEPEQAAGILDLYLGEFTGRTLADYPDRADLKDYSGAEIRQIAVEAAYNGGHLAAAARFVIPQSKTNKDALDALTKWAAGRTIPAHIPEEFTGRKITL
jgi:hypothetical protein